MKIKKYAVFFLIVFSLFLAAPSIMSIVEETADISYFFDGTEEEKKGENETKENTLVLTIHTEHYDTLHGLSYNLDNHCHTSRTYSEVTLDKPLLPPEIS